MNDARPKQQLVSEFNIRLTANNTTTPKKYSWVEVYRDGTGNWNNLTVSGNITYDPAYEYNNGNATLSAVYQAHRDPRTGQVLFFYRSGGGLSTPCPSSVSLVLGWTHNRTATYCKDYSWLNQDKGKIGWKIDETVLGVKSYNGTALISKVVVEWSEDGVSGWNTIHTINQATDPDPRVFSYYLFPTAAGIYFRARYTGNYAAVSASAGPQAGLSHGAGVYCNLKQTEFSSPIVKLATGQSSVNLTGIFDVDNMNAPARVTGISSWKATITGMNFDPGTAATFIAYWSRATGKSFTGTKVSDGQNGSGFAVTTSPQPPPYVFLSAMPDQPGSVDYTLGANPRTMGGCTMTGNFLQLIQNNIMGGYFSLGGSYVMFGWINGLDTYGYAPIGTAVLPSVASGFSGVMGGAVGGRNNDGTQFYERYTPLPLTLTGTTNIAVYPIALASWTIELT